MASKEDPPGESLSSRRVRRTDAPSTVVSDLRNDTRVAARETIPPAPRRPDPHHSRLSARADNLQSKDQVGEVPRHRQVYHNSTSRPARSDNGPRFKDQVRDVDPYERSDLQSSFTQISQSDDSGLPSAHQIETIAIVEGYVTPEVSQEQHEPGFPPAPFADRFMDKSFLDELKGIQKEIKQLTNLVQCRDLYKSRSFIDGLNLIRSAQKQYCDAHRDAPADAKEEWAQRWALAKNEPRAENTEWAWILDECRRTALGLLYKMCNFGMGKEAEVLDDNESVEMISLDRLRDKNYLMVVDAIASLCIVMDRANCLYHMGHDATNVTGLVWYSAVAEETLPEHYKNPTGSLMNKRLLWLFDNVLESVSQDMLQRWMEVALPVRLRQQEP